MVHIICKGKGVYGLLWVSCWGSLLCTMPVEAVEGLRRRAVAQCVGCFCLLPWASRSTQLILHGPAPLTLPFFVSHFVPNSLIITYNTTFLLYIKINSSHFKIYRLALEGHRFPVVVYWNKTIPHRFSRCVVPHKTRSLHEEKEGRQEGYFLLEYLCELM